LRDGRITDAEAYMRDRRDELQTHGYQIRKLNQAYFALYGSYGDGFAASPANPIPGLLRALRQQSGSLAEFVFRVRGITTVDELSGGRVLYGIGSGDRPVTELGLAPARVRVVREMVTASRRLLAGETVSWDSTAFRLHDATLRYARRPTLPIYLAASGPRMLELVGEVADGGLILAGQNAASVRYVQEHVARGAQRAGRDPADVELVYMLYGSVNENRQLARDESRTMAAWFAQTAPQYAELAGVEPALVVRVREAYGGSEFHHARAAADLCPDAMVDQLTFANTPDSAIARLEALVALGVRAFNLFPMGSDRWGTIQSFMDRVIPRFR